MEDLKIVVLISGKGSNLKAIAKECSKKNVRAKIVSIISNNPNIIRSPLIGKSIPNFQLTNIDGTQSINQNIMSGDLKLLNVWASWCFACIAEHSVLTEINSKNLIQ